MWQCWRNHTTYDPARHRALQRHITVTSRGQAQSSTPRPPRSWADPVCGRRDLATPAPGYLTNPFPFERQEVDTGRLWRLVDCPSWWALTRQLARRAWLLLGSRDRPDVSRHIVPGIIWHVQSSISSASRRPWVLSAASRGSRSETHHSSQIARSCGSMNAAPGLADARQAQCGELIDFEGAIVGEVVGVCGWRSSGDEEVTVNNAIFMINRNTQTSCQAQSAQLPDRQGEARTLAESSRRRSMHRDERRTGCALLRNCWRPEGGPLPGVPLRRCVVAGSRIEESVSADRIARAETLTDPCGGERSGPTRTRRRGLSQRRPTSAPTRLSPRVRTTPTALPAIAPGGPAMKPMAAPVTAPASSLPPAISSIVVRSSSGALTSPMVLDSDQQHTAIICRRDARLQRALERESCLRAIAFVPVRSPN